MAKYFILWKAFFLNSLTRDMEFKANFLGGLFIDIIYYGSYFFFFSIIFAFVDDIGVFTKQDVTIFLVITFLTDTLYMMFFAGNIWRLNRYIVRGDLDYILLKPVNTQFFVSLRYVKSYALVSVVILVIILLQLVLGSNNHITMTNVAFFIPSFLMGVSLWVSIDFIISCLAFWFKNFGSAGWLGHEVMKFGTRPDTIYTGWMRKLMFSILPLAFVSSVPTRILLFGPDFTFLVGQVIASTLMFVVAQIIWYNGVKRYESASS